MTFTRVEAGSYELLGGEDDNVLYLRLAHRAYGVEAYTWYSFIPQGWLECPAAKSEALDKDHEEQYAKQ